MSDKPNSQQPKKEEKPSVSSEELAESELDKVTGGVQNIVVTKPTDSSSPNF
jgi:hypothetical protein